MRRSGRSPRADEILLDAKLVIDDHAQTTYSGEINAPYNEGILTDDDIHGVLGEVVGGERDGRTDDDVTIFDSTANLR